MRRNVAFLHYYEQSKLKKGMKEINDKIKQQQKTHSEDKSQFKDDLAKFSKSLQNFYKTHSEDKSDDLMSSLLKQISDKESDFYKRNSILIEIIGKILNHIHLWNTNKGINQLETGINQLGMKLEDIYEKNSILIDFLGRSIVKENILNTNDGYYRLKNNVERIVSKFSRYVETKNHDTLIEFLGEILLIIK
jgi:hypothetical protein